MKLHPFRHILFFLIFWLSVPAVAQESFSLTVPIDHTDPEGPKASLAYEFGAPYDPAKPIIFIIADGQQFYVREKRVAALQDRLFGPDFNVAGIVGRGASEAFINHALDKKGDPDWQKAWRIFRAEQWIEDIEAVRREVAGGDAKIMLYGASGGAFLAHQYLAKYGRHVSRAYTAAPVMPDLAYQLGLNPDRFWQEIGAYDVALRSAVWAILRRDDLDRPRFAKTLQRQNFFVPVADLGAERARLIRAIASNNQDAYDKAQTDYQVKILMDYMQTPAAIPIRVRLFEFAAPKHIRELIGGIEFHPDLEDQYYTAEPLFTLMDAGKIPRPGFDFTPLPRLDTEILIVAGRHDHTVDYRTAAALAAYYPNARLITVDDGHMFQKLKDNGDDAVLIQAFLKGGAGSAMTAAGPYLWISAN